MEPFRALKAAACPLDMENIDTDQLIPARFMSRPRASGYDRYLLHDLRFAPDGAPLPFALDDPRRAGARIIVARRNFGTGSSREAAVYALWDYGIRCVIAPSFGDIFASNAVKNGLLPAQVAESDADTLLRLAAEAGAEFDVDLKSQTIACGPVSFGFRIDPVRRLQLLNGWDDLDLTMRHRDAIDDFRGRHLERTPWAMPAERTG